MRKEDYIFKITPLSLEEVKQLEELLSNKNPIDITKGWEHGGKKPLMYVSSYANGDGGYDHLLLIYAEDGGFHCLPPGYSLQLLCEDGKIYIPTSTEQGGLLFEKLLPGRRYDYHLVNLD